jgi:catechol 2,3-dioxygenase-like lactoylglutathione lyase family enzyme
MRIAMFRQLHPILGTRDLERALDFYIQRLGFTLSFRDPSGPDNYAGVRRDGVELHLQWQDESEMGPTRLRFLVEDPDALLVEYQGKQVCGERARLTDTPWGTREFAFHDPDGNALTFYRDSKKSDCSA